MRREQRETIGREDQEQFDIVMQILKAKAQTLRFPMYITKSMEETDIAELELTVRSSNCLRRAGFHTIGELVDGIETSGDLKRIRNCGAKSVREIMNKLLRYQYGLLSSERKERYLQRLLDMNLGDS